MATKILTYDGLSKYTEDIVDYVDDKAIELTQSEYDALPSEVQNDGTIYFITDGGGSGGSASDVAYNNSSSGLVATNVQSAIDEVYSGISDKMNTSNPTGTGSFSLNRKANTTVGDYSFAEGYNATASGNYSHAEGANTTASGSDSHAEGSYTTAKGIYSHAEGAYTIASGWNSHAEGGGTTASGSSSHAEGDNTTAQRKSQHVFGEYNVLDTAGTTTTRGNYVEIVGNGTSSARSNARTLDWSGNEVLAGTLTTTGVNLPSGSTWDGTNTSLASAISTIRSNMYNIPVDPSDTSNINIWIETT